MKGKNPLKDRNVRKALYQAIDIEAIKSKVMRGAATPAGLLLAPKLGGFNEALNDRLPYDPEASMALLAEAGYPDGFDIQLDCPNNRYVNDEQICQVVAGMFARVGVKVNLLAQPKSKFFAKLKEHDISMYLLGWIPDDQDAGSVIAHLMVPPADGGLPWNGGGYGNPRVTELSRMITSEIDAEKRQKMIDEAFSIVKDDVGYIPLHQQALSWGVDLGKNVENYATLHTNGTGAFKLVSRVPGVKTVLTLNRDWWDLPNQNFNVTDVIFTPIGSDATRTAALLSGELDLMFPAPVQDVARINGSGVATALQGPELRTIFLGMDQERDELLYSSVKGKNPLKDE